MTNSRKTSWQHSYFRQDFHMLSAEILFSIETRSFMATRGGSRISGKRGGGGGHMYIYENKYILYKGVRFASNAKFITFSYISHEYEIMWSH